jgi:putative transposase
MARDETMRSKFLSGQDARETTSASIVRLCLVNDGGINVIRLTPPLSPSLNAYAERFVRSIKDECLDRIVFVGRRRCVVRWAEYVNHCHCERNHQGAR